MFIFFAAALLYFIASLLWIITRNIYNDFDIKLNKDKVMITAKSDNDKNVFTQYMAHSFSRNADIIDIQNSDEHQLCIREKLPTKTIKMTIKNMDSQSIDFIRHLFTMNNTKANKYLDCQPDSHKPGLVIDNPESTNHERHDYNFLDITPQDETPGVSPQEIDGRQRAQQSKPENACRIGESANRPRNDKKQNRKKQSGKKQNPKKQNHKKQNRKK